MNWKCFFGLHDWSRWRNITIHLTVDIMPDYEGDVDGQTRDCKRCNKRQTVQI